VIDPSQVTDVHSTLYNFFYSLYPELKFWASFAALIIGGYKGYQWLKAIKTNDLFHIHQSVEALEQSMKQQTKDFQAAMEKQTNSVVGEIKELRADLRTFTSAFIVPPRRARTKK